MTGLVCFDVDGTLVRPKTGNEFRQDADDWELLPGRRQCVLDLLADRVRVALVSNQGGVAFGFFTRSAMHQALYDVARALDPLPDPPPIYTLRVAVYYCLHHANGTVPQYARSCFYRKPQPGMLLKAMLDTGAWPRNTLMIGDRAEDEEAAKAAGVGFRWSDEYFSEEH